MTSTANHLDSNIKDLVDNVRKFVAKEILPYTEELDREQRLAPGIFKKLGEQELLGVSAPLEYGGKELGSVALVAVCEELSYADPGTCMSYLSHTIMFIQNIATYGSAEQCRKYLPAAINGELIGGMAVTEPSAGSDFLSMATYAQQDEDGFIINGKKTYITNGTIADAIITYAKTSENYKGISAFIIDKDILGVQAGKKQKKMGLRASPMSEINLKDCNVPSSSLLGSLDGAYPQVKIILEYERLGLAAMSLGITRACLDRSLKFASKRKQFSKTIIDFQSVSEKIANLFIRYRAARSLVFETALLLDKGRDASQETSAAKVFSCETATLAALDTIQIYGCLGCLDETGVERFLRDAKVLEICGGTTEVLKCSIVRQFQKKVAAAKEKLHTSQQTSSTTSLTPEKEKEKEKNEENKNSPSQENA